jgi:hypothetical protein
MDPPKSLIDTRRTGTATRATAVRYRFNRAIMTAMNTRVPMALTTISSPCWNKV